ncbi:MAG: UDP binding domain-containing protein, partial [Candidatus Freyarchaeota archaeon]
IKIVRNLLEEGARVVVHDPKAMENAKRIFGDEVEYADTALSALEGAECSMIVTEWDEYRKLSLRDIKEMMKVPVIIDGRRIINPKEAEQLGFTYRGIGFGRRV